MKSLLSVMDEFSQILYIQFNSELTEGLTITRLALNIFFKKYYFYKNKAIPLINKLFLFDFIKEAYFGGITEVYKPFGKDLNYIDVNSLYPFAAINPMPGIECNYIESLDQINGLNLENLFGFFYAKVKTNDQYLGLLPVRRDNRLIFPNGKFEGIWTSEELKFAKEKGYEILVMKGYNFNKVFSLFDRFIFDLFNLKSKSVGSIRIIAKSLLNNLLGRFGLNMIKPITQLVNTKLKDFISSTRIINTINIINKDKFLITYEPRISKKICEEHGLDYIKILTKDKKTNIEKQLDIFKDISIAISAMNTSYARIHMNKIKLDILNNGGNIYYSDTDSLVVDKKLDISNLLGNELGKFKIEFKNIKEAYFISNKTYCLVLDNNEIIIKAKGIKNNSINLEDFKAMYFNKRNISAKKINTKTNYEKGSVLIEEKNVILNSDIYSKREKIYNDKGIWIDTKPLKLNNNL